MEIDKKGLPKSDMRRLWICGIVIISALTAAHIILDTEFYIRIISVPVAVILLDIINTSGIIEYKYKTSNEPLPTIIEQKL